MLLPETKGKHLHFLILLQCLCNHHHMFVSNAAHLHWDLQLAKSHVLDVDQLLKSVLIQLLLLSYPWLQRNAQLFELVSCAHQSLHLWEIFDLVDYYEATWGYLFVHGRIETHCLVDFLDNHTNTFRRRLFSLIYRYNSIKSIRLVISWSNIFLSTLPKPMMFGYKLLMLSIAFIILSFSLFNLSSIFLRLQNSRKRSPSE